MDSTYALYLNAIYRQNVAAVEVRQCSSCCALSASRWPHLAPASVCGMLANDLSGDTDPTYTTLIEFCPFLILCL